MRSADWRYDAACREADPELFFPDGDLRSAQIRVKMAKRICRGCPVSTTCLSWALSTSQEAGIWGGLTEPERRKLRHRLPVAITSSTRTHHGKARSQLI